MSTQPSDRGTTRAEARRRARMAARGELPEEDEAAEPAANAPRGGFLTRIFPPAPPLPNKPPPLAGFDESGPLRPIRVRLFLLRRNPMAWLGTGLVAAVGYYASVRTGQTDLVSGTTDVLSLVGTFVLFGALIAAGWFGWQRPTLFGTAAAIIGFILASALVLLSFARLGVGPDTFGVGAIGQLFIQALYLSGLGFLGGWYGGYLRRRQAQLSAQVRPRQRRR
jgi:hypothetical protein